MTTSLPISCFIIAQNEADRIATTINSIKGWVDEVIVIDSGSTDNTISIAEGLSAHAVYHAWPGYGMQKRFGEEQCKNDWLLNLDADEEMTPALIREIQSLFAQGLPAQAGFRLKVRDLLPGETKLAPFAHTNSVIRLYDKRKGRFSDSPVHDSVIMQEGEVRELVAPVLHRSFRSLAHMRAKIASYSDAQARELQRKPMKYAHARLFIEFPFAFLKMYVLRGYALRGLRGILYSGVYAYGRLLRVIKYLQLKH